MSSKDLAVKEINSLPDSAIDKVIEFIMFQKYMLGLFENDTDYLESIPGMVDKIKDGMNTPLSDCVPLSEVWADV